MDASVRYFDAQFDKQVRARDLKLNPFEQRALPYLKGDMLDYGCGLGNLSIAAARQGCRVLALDASPTAVQHLADEAAREQLPITASCADLRSYRIEQDVDAAVAIGLLMFFPRQDALRQLAQLQDRVRPGGVAVINVLVEGTTFMDMFDPQSYHLFNIDELRQRFDRWELLSDALDSFEAPGGSTKEFVTLIARKPE
jgi:tellurite methyltransferase